uniref:Uncharacterized protein n=1 Tax=Pithovirus LCPAC201 TaxID=2506591 RepID=A0A481Z799_9VIRU|nr:MAG: uncharacterized protein LCPAC201_02610 [Pithovirus LCPAC201]
MDSLTSDLSLNQMKRGSNIYVVCSETEEIIQYHVSNYDTTFEGVIHNLKELGKPSNLFYYNGDTTQIKPTDKINSYLPSRQNQVIFWAASNQLEFPVVQPKENNILVLMITPNFKMLAFNVSGSTDINQITSGYGSLVKLADGNQTKIVGGTVSDNLPIRSNQIIFLLKEIWYKNCANSESYVTLEGWEQNTDYIQIYSRNRRTGELNEKPVCYDRQTMINFMETKVFADWVPSPDYNSPGQFQTIDDRGHGGEPGKKRYYGTILSYYIDQASYRHLKDLTIRKYIKEPRLLNQRIGNLRGQFGISQHHGQLPGFTIYSLRAKPQ